MKSFSCEQIAESEILSKFRDPMVTDDERGRLLSEHLKTLENPRVALSAKQRLKALLKRLPPVKQLLRRRYEIAFANAEKCNLFHGVYKSFPEAVAAAPKTKGIGYDQPGPAALYRNHLNEIFAMDLPALLWMQVALQRGVRRVFDLGGHVGVAYYSFGKALQSSDDLEWVVYDVPAVREAGRALAESRGATKISFVANQDEADGTDLYYAAGSSQYSEESLAHLLSRLRSKPAHVLVNKIPFTANPTRATLQNIGVAFCPYWITNRAEFVAAVQALGYELVHNWKTPNLSCEIPFEHKYADIRYEGFYFRQKARAE